MTAVPALPPGLRERVLAASLAVRTAGRPVPEPAPISPVEAFERGADAFAELLARLGDEDWHRPVLRGLDVQGLVGHLTGVDADFRRALAGDAEVADADHVASTQAAAARQGGRRPDRTRADWRDAADRTLRSVAGADLDRELAMHGIRLPVGALLVVRVFELWTHENDIRAVAGLPPRAPDASTLRLMTDLAARLLPHGMCRAHPAADPLNVHLVLTGGGGGTWDVGLGAPADGNGAAQDLVLVVDAVDFCRLVADRVDPALLDVHLAGATERAEQVFAGAAALALD